MSPNRPASRERLSVYVGSAVGLLRTAGQLFDGRTGNLEDPTTRAEGADISTKWVLIVGIGLLLGIWAIVLLLYPLFIFFQYDRTGGKEPVKVLNYLPPLPPTPRNESDPYYTLDQFRAGEIHALSTYSWVNKSQGIVSIPIVQAIQILAKTGIPPSQSGGTEYYAPSAGSMRTGSERKVLPSPR